MASSKLFSGDLNWKVKQKGVTSVCCAYAFVLCRVEVGRAHVSIHPKKAGHHPRSFALADIVEVGTRLVGFKALFFCF